MKDNIRISIIELDYHPEVLRNTCRILEGTGMYVSVYTTKQIWAQVNIYQDGLPEKFTLRTFDGRKATPGGFFKKHLDEINRCEVVLFNTLASNYRLFSRLPFGPPVVVRVHNTHTFFKSLSQAYKPRFTAFYLWKDLSHFVRNTLCRMDWHYRNKFLAQAEYYAFPSEVIRQYAVDTLGVNRHQCISLPFSYALPAQKGEAKNKDVVTITVPGRVEKRSRDYNLLSGAFEELAAFMDNTDYSIRLVLLGRADSVYGRRIVKRLQSIDAGKFSLVSFDGFVDQQVFADYMGQTDFFVLPVNINTRHTVYEEIYGYTKISGGISDVISYRKPALIPALYPIEEPLTSMTDVFEDRKTLAEKIRSWCEGRVFNSLDIETALKPFALERIQEKYKEAIRRIAAGQG